MPINLVESIKAQFFKSNQQYNISDDYKALLSEPNDSDEEVKKKYYKLAKEYHPDTLVSKGLPDEFLKFANERLSSINEAYDRITQSRKDQK
jgi:DnaJ like chaperone protein